MAHNLRLATYNIEWFTALFDEHDRLRLDNTPSSRYETSCKMQLDAVAHVLSQINADGIMIIEAPDSDKTHKSTRALEHFADHYKLRTRKAASGFISHTEQEISFLYDPDTLKAAHTPKGSIPFNTSYRLPQLDTPVQFSKPPLELSVQVLAHDIMLRLIGVHIKSKAAHGAKTAAHEQQIARENRRKQLCEAVWLRQNIRETIKDDPYLMVMGDFNDEPGLDDYEKIFGYSSLEIIMGQEDQKEPKLFDPHGTKTCKNGEIATSRFWDPEKKAYFEALLDFIMITDRFTPFDPRWHIWHPHNSAKARADERLQKALLTASDHFPVTLDLMIKP